MKLGLHGLRAVVTGGSAGIGAATVRVLAEEGCDVAFCARGAGRIQAMLASVAGLPGQVTGAVVDVTDAQAFDHWLDAVGPFHIFVANVSALSADWATTVAVDILATQRCTDAAARRLQGMPHAAITYIGSKAGSLAPPQSAAYGAAKAAMAHAMKSLALRLLPAVRVNTVSPGDTLVAGGFWDQVRLQEPEAYARVLARNPLQRLATPDDVARVVAFVSSPAASFVAGSNWYVDGGATQHVQL